MFKGSNLRARNRLKSLLFTLMIFYLLPCLVYAIEIRIPSTSAHDVRDEFPIELLKFLLKRIPGEHKITRSLKHLSQARIVAELKKGGDNINLCWLGTSAALERDLLPVYFPIFRGLLGYRVFIINKKDQEIFSKIKRLEDLQKYQGVQGIGWADTEILEYAGLKQVTVVYEHIFQMMNKGRISYFSRGVNEAYREVAVRQDKMKNLLVDERLLLVYPLVSYFFTHADNHELAALLRQAFSEAYQDGSFLNFFSSHPQIKETLKHLNINNRVRLDIANPFLTPETMALPLGYFSPIPSQR